MEFFVYIIYSKTIDKYYIGHTYDVSKRIVEHQERKNLGTVDWELKYTEIYSSRSEASKRESEIKSKKRRSYIELLINPHD